LAVRPGEPFRELFFQFVHDNHVEPADLFHIL
jgi:hypothetical protein